TVAGRQQRIALLGREQRQAQGSCGLDHRRSVEQDQPACLDRPAERVGHAGRARLAAERPLEHLPGPRAAAGPRPTPRAPARPTEASLAWRPKPTAIPTAEATL